MFKHPNKFREAKKIPYGFKKTCITYKYNVRIERFEGRDFNVIALQISH